MIIIIKKDMPHLKDLSHFSWNTIQIHFHQFLTVESILHGAASMT